MQTSAKLAAFRQGGSQSFRLVQSRFAQSEAAAVTLRSEKHKRYMRIADVDPEAEFSATTSAAAKAVARGNRIELTLSHQPGVELGDLEVEKLMNGMMVASVPTAYPAYHVQLAVKAGSRFEQPWSLGVSHVVRRMFGLASKPFRFAVNQNRTLQQVGAHVECSSSRELTQYSLSQYKFTDEAIDIAGTALACASTMPAMYPWEISRNMPMLRQDLAQVTGTSVQLFEQLHAVAFRSGLANSLWCPEHRMSDINSDTVEQYINELFTPDRFALIGVGLPLATLKDLAHKFCFLEPQNVDVKRSDWLGGESRIENGNPSVNIALAVQAANVADQRSAAAQTVLAALLRDALDFNGTNGPVTVTPINMQYSDNGLFGLHIVCNYLDADAAVKQSLLKLQELKSSPPAAAAVEAARSTAQRALSEQQLQPQSRLSELATHLLLNGAADTAAAVADVTPEDVAAAVKAVFSGKRMAMASLGRLDHVPFRDDLSV